MPQKSRDNKDDDNQAFIGLMKKDAPKWNFTSDSNYVCFITINGANLAVTDFTITSSTSNFFKIEVLFLSKSELDFKTIDKTTATLSLFFNDKTQSYEKVIKAKIRKFYHQGESFILESVIRSKSPVPYYVYKVELYPELYELTLKVKNYIYRLNEENKKITVAKRVFEDYNINYSCNAIEANLKVHDSITQYQETDSDFVIRMVEESDLILYYNFQYETPELTIIQNSQAISSLTNISFVKRPAEIKNEYRQDEVISLFVDQDYGFNAKISSCKLFAGDIFALDGDFSTRYFINESILRFEYINNRWRVVNHLKGFVLGNAKTYLTKLKKRPNISGVIRGVVVSDTKDTFHVNKQGQVQVRLLWHVKSDETSDDSIFFGSDIKEEIINDVWDLNAASSDVTKWVPVSQWGSSGNEFGNYNLPRAGQEVLVWFYQGDPDRPIVMGMIYNDMNQFPNISYEEDDSKVLNQAVSLSPKDLPLQNVLPDNDLLKSNISTAAADLVFKHYSYDDEKGTKTDRFNEISMINNYNDEKIHLMSSNLINLRSDNNMHIQINELYRGVFENQKETINNKREFYIFGDDHYSIMNANRYSYYLSLSSKRSSKQKLAAGGLAKSSSGMSDQLVGDKRSHGMTESEMLLIQSCKTEASKGFLTPYFNGGSYHLAIYDLAISANVFFAGAFVNFLLLGNITNICAMGAFEIYSNMLTINVLGKTSYKCLGAFSGQIVGSASMKFTSLFSMKVMAKASFSFSSMDLSSGKTKIKTAKTDIKTGDLNLTSGKTNIMFGKSTIKVGDCDVNIGKVNIKAAKFDLTCADLSIKAAKISIVSASQISFTGVIFSVVAGARVALTAALVQLG